MWSQCELGVNEVEVDLNLQMRANEPPPEEYEEIFRKNKGSWPFPAVRIIKAGDRLLLVEGFTRMRAAVAAGRTKVLADVRTGSWADAVAEACGSNADHGFRRNSADKRRAIIRAHEELSKSPTKIAGICKVSRATVYTVLEELRPAAATRTTTPAATTGTTADAIAPAPSRPAARSEITDSCPVCGANSWTATDAGYVCDICRHEHGEVAAIEDEDREERASRRELIEEGVNRDLATANSDFGRLVRSLSRVGLGPETERPMLQINKKIQEAIRSQRRSS